MLGLGRILAILRKEGASVPVDEIIDASKGYELQPIVKSFNLFLKDLKVGVLSYSKENGTWYFEYSEEFKHNSNNYNLIIGFPDINKRYESDRLWPFFNIRIPGLQQPKVKEILIKENISPDDNVQLLERFGKRSISNPFELEVNV